MAERDRGLHRHGEPDPSNWDEQPTYAGKEQKVPQPNTTFASRSKAVQSAENKAVVGGETGLEGKKKAELVDLARDRGVEGYSSMTKAELVDALGG